MSRAVKKYYCGSLPFESFDKLAREIKHISGQDIAIYREEFPIGLYLICLKEDNKIISTKKIMIED